MTLIAVINLTFSSVVLVTHINLKIYKSIMKTNKILYKLPYVTKSITKTNKILYKAILVQ